MNKIKLQYPFILIIILVLALFSGLIILSQAEDMPNQGVFRGYFFVDRWGQGVFDYLYVDPGLFPQLKQDEWRPVTVTATSIVQWMNPGGAMIKKISQVELPEQPQFNIKLGLINETITYGGSAILWVGITNNSKSNHTLYKRDLKLNITVHKRGTLPGGEKVERDTIYDCFNNPYDDDAVKCMRATVSLALVMNNGKINMENGNPQLYPPKSIKQITDTSGPYPKIRLVETEPKIVDGEKQETLARGKSTTLFYQLGDDWLINEYELQASYRPYPTNDEYVLSKPISFDVKAPVLEEEKK
ncbi:MAG: hypothetical protein WC980_10600 [Candidatus Brocadiia bacterium]